MAHGTFKRSLTQAARDTHVCVGCNLGIELGYSYITDMLVQRVGGPYGNMRPVATCKWHLGCAPVVKEEAEAFIRGEHLRVS